MPNAVDDATHANEPEQPGDKVLYEVADRVATISLNEPDHLNPLTFGPDGSVPQLLEALASADGDPEVRCIVITGRGRAFSAGGDIRRDRTGHSSFATYEGSDAASKMHERFRTNRKPIIGAINGLCYGGAMALAAHFDLLVAVEEARFCLMEARFGSSGAEIFPFLIGPQWTKFLVLTGESVSAQRAKDIGLVLEVFPSDMFHYKVYDLARRIAAMPPHAAILNRRIVNGAMNVLGWMGQKEFAVALSSLNRSMLADAETVDGRRFFEILREDGLPAFKEARDAPFSPPWLES